MIKKYICFFVIIISLISNYALAKNNITDHNRYVNTDVSFFDQDGNKVFLDQYEDYTLLLVFWASWCGTCVNEIPLLDNLQKDLRKLPFKVLAVSEDYQGVDIVAKYFKEHEIRHLEIFHDYQNKLFRNLSISALPTALLINPEGKIKKIFKGRIKWNDEKIRTMILQEIKGNHEMPKNTYQDSSLNMKLLQPNKEMKQNISTQNKNDNAEEKNAN